MSISVASIFAAAYFGLNFNPAATNTATESRIYPVSPVAYRMVQPDGKARIFELSDAGQGVLTGPKPWLGVVKGRRIDVWADPEHTGGKLRTAFTFVAGRLRLMVLDGVKYTFAKPEGPADDLTSFFPDRKKRSYEKNSTADIWRGDAGRMRLWFANPNSAGALLAGILLVFVWLATRSAGFVRIAVGVLATIAAYGMLSTGSRGALAGAAAGLSVMAIPHARKIFTWRGLLVSISAALVLCAVLAASGKAGRIADTFRAIDAGNMTRLKTGKAAVQMFADAPFGWRGGEVPGRNACLNWYVFDEAHVLRTHILSLAECGWFTGWLYVAAWMLVLSAGAAAAKKGNALPVSLWLSFGIAGCFNPVYRDWETWILPVASLSVFAFPAYRLSLGQWRVAALSAALSATLAVSGLVAAGKSMARPVKIPVRSCGKATFVNGADPKVWVVGDPLVMAGNGFPGREILAHFVRNPSGSAVAYVYDVDDLPDRAEFVVVAGRNVPDYLAAYAEGRACKASRLLLLSPSVGPDAVPESLVEESNLIFAAGSLLAERDPAYAEKRTWIKIASGCERYIPGWTDFLLQ